MAKNRFEFVNVKYSNDKNIHRMTFTQTSTTFVFLEHLKQIAVEQKHLIR